MWERMASDLYSNITVVEHKFCNKSLIHAE